MSNRKAGELTKYLAALSHLGFKKDDERIIKIINEIEKELELTPIDISKAPTPVKDTNKALVIGIKDCSGSVGTWENHCFNEYYKLAINEIKKRYSDVQELFITHHTEAKVVSENEFFSKNESGGTIVSRALKELIKHLETDREVIVLQFSDGDNLTSDTTRVIKLLNEEILPKIKYYKYFEANQYNRKSTISETIFNKIKNQKLSCMIATEKDHSLKGMRIGEELDSLNQVCN
jgi:uncharacterized sporulation protein YeaH/YhbH (DUF444 family)